MTSEQIVEMLGHSGVLALLGMGIVFSFLFIMVLAVSLMGKLLKPGIEPAVLATPAGTSGQAASTTGDGSQITAVISAAVSKYRNSQL